MNRYTCSNIITRREIEPLLPKAAETLKTYEQALGFEVWAMDQNGRLIGGEGKGPANSFCAFCKAYCRAGNGQQEDEDLPCAALHTEAMARAQCSGGLYLYVCDMGFMFWSSPLFSKGRLFGALTAGRVLGIPRQESIERICSLSGGLISAEDAGIFLAEIPEKSREEVSVLARLLLICAEEVSRGGASGESAENAAALPFPLKLLPVKSRNNSGPEEAQHPLDQERTLMAALRRGDNETGQKVLGKMLDTILSWNNGSFRVMQLKAVELTALLFRAALKGGQNGDEELWESNARYLQKIQDSKDVESLKSILKNIVERMSSRIFSFHGLQHAAALRKAEKFIWENYTRKISLQEIASASGLSAPYFSTVFKNERGENLSDYLNRLRIEKASAALIESDMSLQEIAAVCGFEDQSWFSKIFKNFTGQSPGKFRESGGNPGLSRML